MTENTSIEPERMAVTRTFNATPELLWKAWTDPHLVSQWWGPVGFTCPVCNIDLRVNGKFFIGMRTPDGQDFFNAGQYHEIVPHQKIVSSMHFSDSQGNKVAPEHYGIEHQSIEDAYDVTTFEDLGDGQTKLTFTGNETMEEAKSTGQLEGWLQILDKFETVVTGLAH
jgi:uncharacterized protein YndB with AHSA1/START domain